MEKKNTKKDSIRDDLLRFLFVNGRVRAAEARMFMSYRYQNPGMGSTLYREFLKEGIITEITYKLSVRKRRGTKEMEDVVIAITKEGEEKILKSYPHLKASNEYRMESNEQRVESKALYKKLTDRGVMLMFWAAGVPVFPDEKPSLDHLKGIFLNTDIKIEGYRDCLDQKECKEFLENNVGKNGEIISYGGAYYTSEEFLEYIKRNETLGDTFRGTRIRGVFMSNKNCYLVFAQRRFSDTMLSVTYKSERGLLTALKKALSFTDIYRPIPQLSSKSYVRYNKPQAIIISDGKKLVYEMATGDVKGKGKETRDMIKSVSAIEKYNAMHIDDEEGKRATTYLTAGTDLFEDIYVTPLSLSGIDALGYLLANSKESMIAEARSVIESIPDFYKTDDTVLYPYRSKKYKDNAAMPEYIPVYNVKQLRWIRERGGEPLIITDEDMLNPIAHSIKLPAHYYDPYSGKEYPKDMVLSYTKTGHIEGLEKLKEDLKDKGLSLKNNFDWSTLHKKFGISQSELYNKIARGEITAEEIMGIAETKEYKEPKSKSNKKKAVSVRMSPEQYRYITEKSTEEGISRSAYIKKLIRLAQEKSEK